MTRAAVVACAAFAMTACGDLSKSLGTLESDRFQAVKAPPLSVPPEFNLRPPVPGGRGAPNQRAVDYARQTVFGLNEPGVAPGGQTITPTSQSTGEKALLSKAHARAGSVPNIRSTVDEETEAIKQTEDGFVDKVLTWDEDAAEEGAEEEGVFKRIITDEGKPEISRSGGIFE